MKCSNNHWHHSFELTSERYSWCFSSETHIRTLFYESVPGNYYFAQNKISPVRELWVLLNTLNSHSDQYDTRSYRRKRSLIFQIHNWIVNTIQMFQTFKSLPPWFILQIADSRLVVITSASKSLLCNQLTSSHSYIQTASTNVQFYHHQYNLFSVTSFTNGLLKLMLREVLESFLCCLRAVYIFYTAAKWFDTITFQDLGILSSHIKMCKSNNPTYPILHRELQVPTLLSKQIRRSIQVPNTKDFVVCVVNKSVDNHKTPLGSN